MDGDFVDRMRSREVFVSGCGGTHALARTHSHELYHVIYNFNTDRRV